MGCTSELGGNLGIVWIVEDDNDLEHILTHGPTPPYIAVLDREHFARKNLLRFKQNLNRVAGVIFLDQNHEDSKTRGLSSFSPDDICPNRYSGLYANDSRYSDCKANNWQKESPVSGLLYDDIPFPIFLINDKQSSIDIQSCFKDHNLLEMRVEGSNKTKKSQDSYPLCGMQLDSFMTASTDAQLCLNSHMLVDEILQMNGRRCTQVENHNIFAYYKPTSGPLHPNNDTNWMTPDVTPKQSIVMLIAKLTSFSMFTDISPGADSTLTSIVTLLAVAEALGRVRNTSDVTKSNRNLAFAFLDSEPFDYIGSSRMVYSMKENNFPYILHVPKQSNVTLAVQNTNLTSIEYVINLDQMANYPNTNAIFFHSNPDDESNDKLKRLFKTMQRIAISEKVEFIYEDPKLPLPPTPVHQFIKGSQKLDQDKLIGIVLSNYGKNYNNQFYHSIYDDSHNVFQTSKSKLIAHIAQSARFIARSLYEITFNVDSPAGLEVDKKIIEQLLECYLIDAQCHLFTQAWQAGQKLPSGPIQTFKDPTKRSDDMNAAITTHLLAYFIGDKISDYNLTKCYEVNEKDLLYNYQYINGQDEPITNASSGICLRSQVVLLSAQSPAYSYNDEGYVIDSKYPAWTFSYNSIRNPVRLYLVASPLSQWCIFLLGIITTALSVIAIYHVGEVSKLNSMENAQTGTPA